MLLKKLNACKVKKFGGCSGNTRVFRVLDKLEGKRSLGTKGYEMAATYLEQILELIMLSRYFPTRTLYQTLKEQPYNVVGYLEGTCCLFK
jgi:hypothetical protein